MEMSSTVTFVLLLMSVLHVKVNCQCTAQAAVIGTNSDRAYTAERGRRFYLNTADPAPCSGTINGWRYCFYNPGNIRDNRIYNATFGVYRAVSIGNSVHYQRVSDALTTVSWHGDQITTSPNFKCYDISVNSFTIEAGNLVAACVYDPGEPRRSTRQLDIIGRNAVGYSLMQMNDVSGCSDISLPSDILSSQLSNINNRILHAYATIIVPTPPPTTTMSITEQTTSVTWTMATTNPSETTTPSEAMATTTPSETTTMDATTTPSDGGSSTTMTSSSTTTNPTSRTTTAGPASETPSEETTTVTTDTTTTQMDVTTEVITAASSTASESVGMTTVKPTTDRPMATTSEGTIDLMTTTTQNEQPTTSESGEISSSTQAATTLSSNESTSAETDITSIKEVISTIAQVSAQNKGAVDLKTIIGVVIAAVLLIVAGLIVAVIVAVIVKKRGKSIGGYSLPGKKTQSNGTVNGVENLTYDIGFHNPGSLDSSFNLYDDVANAATASGTGEGNYFEITESGFSNLTYESVNAGGVYSELSAANMSDTQANYNHQRSSQGISCYPESEYYSSPPEESKESLSFLLERNKQEDIYGNLEAYYAPASNENEIYSQLKSCGTNSIPHVQIRTVGHLGSGQFGNVEKGMWQRKEVALKTLKTDSTYEDKVKFLQEAAIMAQFKHPNIVTLHGVASDKEPLMLVVELIHRGDLRDHLHSIRPDSPGELPMAGLSEKLLSFSQHVALGMQYLSGKGFVHRDLAARNILVSKDNICKVADFGMSRDLADETYYVSHGGMIPVKWTAPEAIHYKKYSTASDVWSYGCLLYEIWSLGYKPFEGITNVEVIKILDSNKRLSPPPGCPRTIYELMIKCWDPITSNRPRFRELTIVLTGNPQDVLSIPQEALCAHRLAGVLGSPLEVGKNMYSDLQNKYCSENLYE